MYSTSTGPGLLQQAGAGFSGGGQPVATVKRALKTEKRYQQDHGKIARPRQVGEKDAAQIKVQVEMQRQSEKKARRALARPGPQAKVISGIKATRPALLKEEKPG